MSPYGPLAEWQERLVSGLIDYVAPWILFGILSTILAFSSDDNSVVFAFNPLSFFITLLPVAWALYMGYLAGTTGQSLGMKQSRSPLRRRGHRSADRGQPGARPQPARSRWRGWPTACATSAGCSC